MAFVGSAPGGAGLPVASSFRGFGDPSQEHPSGSFRGFGDGNTPTAFPAPPAGYPGPALYPPSLAAPTYQPEPAPGQGYAPSQASYGSTNPPPAQPYNLSKAGSGGSLPGATSHDSTTALRGPGGASQHKPQFTEDGAEINRDPHTRFGPSSGCNDVGWAIAFVLCNLVVVGLAIGYGRSLSLSDGVKLPGSDSDGSTARAWAVGAAVALGAAVIFTWLAFYLIRTYPLIFVKAGLWFSAIIVAVCMIVSFCLHQTGLGIMFAIALGLQLLYIWIAQSRIAFAAANLQVVADFLHDDRFAAMYLVTAGTVVVQAAFFAFWGFTLYAVNFANGGSGYGSLWAVFLVFDLYWTLQVIANVLHVTVAGVFATWYFYPDQSFPPNPTSQAFKRAMGPSFGSICFGSLIVAVIQVLRSMARSNSGEEESVGAAICRCIVQCILSILEAIVKYVNKYAYARIAIYGIPYWQAAKETYHMLMSSAFEMLVNDDMIGGVCLLTSFIVGAITFFVGGFSGWASVQGASFGAIGILAFVVGLLVCFTAFRLVESCVATLFVAFAEQPTALSFSHPATYAQLQNAWCGRYATLQQYFAPSPYV